MKQILLKGGVFTLVDDDDFDWLSKIKWVIHKDKSGALYVRAGSSIKNGQYRRIFMHRIILGLDKGDSRLVDHENLNGLDNQRRNIRVCTHAENMRNKRAIPNKTSRYKGVIWNKNTSKWDARVMFEKTAIRIISTPFEDDAARAYNQKAKELFGDFAFLNAVADGPIRDGGILHKSNKSGYRGVSFYSRKKKFAATLENGGKVFRLGMYEDPIEAALAYDKKALEIYGDKAKLNFKL